MINVAVVGAGYWGPNLIRNLASLAEASLVTVCDRNPERLKPLADRFRTDVTTRIDDVLSRTEIEAVFIATPAETHFDLAKRCLLAGKHVFVEKPLATTSADARRLCELAEQLDRILMVGHLFQFEPATIRLIEMVRGGKLGVLRYTHGLRMSMSGTARLDTNIIWDALIHDAYIQPELFGRGPSRVLAVGGCYLKQNVEDVGFVIFDFGGGAMFHCTVSWYALEKKRSLMVVGSEGMISYDGLSLKPLVRYDRRYVRSDELDPEGRSYWRWIEGGGEVVETLTAEPLRNECVHFLDCVRNRVRPKTDGWAGLQAVEIIEACAASARAGGVWEAVTHFEMGSSDSKKKISTYYGGR